MEEAARSKRGEPRGGVNLHHLSVTRRGPAGPAPGSAGPNSVGSNCCFASLDDHGDLIVRSLSRRQNMRKKKTRDKQQAQPPWYVKPTTFQVVVFIARLLVGIFGP